MVGLLCEKKYVPLLVTITIIKFMRIKVTNTVIARFIFALTLAVSICACDGADNDSDIPETPGNTEDGTPAEDSNVDQRSEENVSIYSDATDFYFSNDARPEDQIVVSGLGGKPVMWIDIDEYVKSGYAYKYLKISENMSRKDRNADAVIFRDGKKIFTYHITQSHQDSYGYDPADWEIIGSGNVYASFSGGSSAAMWNNSKLTLLEGSSFVTGIGMLKDRYLYSCALAKDKDFRTIIYKDWVQEAGIENCNAADFTVSGLTLFIGGSWAENGKEYPAYWRGAEMTDLSGNKTIEGYVSCIAIDDNDVYTGGTGYMWKNSKCTEMPHDGYDAAVVTDIVIDGSDVYASGYLKKGEDDFRACWWQDGALHLLDLDGNSGSSSATAILRYDGKTYIGGYVGQYRAALWTDGELTRLTAYNGHINALAARGKDEVFAAGDKDGKPVIWRIRSRYAGEKTEMFMNTSEDGAENDDMYGNVTSLIVCAKR